MLLQDFMAARSPYWSHREPLCGGIEQDILSAFSALDIQGMSFWFMMQRRNYHFNIIVIDGLSDPVASSRKRNPLRKPNPLDNLVENGGGHDSEFPKPVEDSEGRYKAALRRQVMQYIDDIHRLMRDCASVFEQVERSGTKEERTVMALVKIHANLNHIQLASPFMARETEHDAYLSEYTSIVELSEDIYPYLSQESNSMYRFFLGIIYPLSRVGFRCQNPDIRGRAINLLQASPYREGIWDAMSMGHLTDWTRKVEEEGMDENGFIPENKRAVMTLCDIDVNTRTAALGCKSVGENGTKFRKEVVEWEHHIGSQYSARLRAEDGRIVSEDPLRPTRSRRIEGAYLAAVRSQPLTVTVRW